MAASSYDQYAHPQQQGQAWKFDGYPKFATWQASSKDVAIFRRFGALSTRCALFLQDELVELEDSIENIDEGCTRLPNYGRNDSFRFDKEKQQNNPNDPHGKRRALMTRAVALTRQYHDYLDSWGKLRALPSAESREIEQIKNWFGNHPNALSEEERQWVDKGGDLVAIAAPPKTPIERWLLRRGNWIRNKLLRFYFRAEEKEWLHVKSATTTYSDERKIQGFANAVVAVLGLLLLVVPMMALTYMTMHNCTFWAKTGVIVGVVGVGFVALSIMSDQKAFQVLLASAAYAAVLLIYLQIGNSNVGAGGGGSPNSSGENASAAQQIAATVSMIEIHRSW